MVLLLAAGAAGAVGLAGYALGKRRERRDIANGFVTYHGNGSGSPQYGNIHYGSSARRYSGRHYSNRYQNSYQPTAMASGSYY